MEKITQTNPFKAFAQWLDEAKEAEPDNHNAMTLASINAAGRPSARIVLLKEWDEAGFVFYTNLASRKARDLAASNAVALLFHWKSLERQIRIEGFASPVSDAQADRYFAGRPRASQIGAWASKQSAPMPGGRDEFQAAIEHYEQKFAGGPVPRPPFWSGFRLKPDLFEFWQEEPFRLHHRVIFKPHARGERAPDDWERTILYP
ncbi:pyridoxine/pyridoxamine 5'-phosphate oxidase [Iodidimonas nitroreducens]|uniref:Pyridoxine/pyridoxamine 5'-phosphate oxidase n=1 Tax=Iodidimonas nitroreducens TaxID=1236968 RepID=A0A5A7N5S5_9PROT|nr:pyridoxamine 5'-phosphate oxidase [Iodidimonas nitroreducens]GAK33628.1 pyridoxine/pyridoxamine 5'-phosphate oxidase [alpha proteobacterium Q-1]GER03673.1 pyridoxine/pyridoxamine 5'-phosphate oxidase [Iodidimonas nitroreducens]